MRLFTALDLPPPHRSALATLRSAIPGTLWVPPENYHLTLRFIGEITDRHRADEIDLALSRISCAALNLTLTGTGLFPGPRSDRLWVGIERNDALLHLQAKIDSALRRIGLPAEKRRFQPHVTIAHIEPGADERVAAWMQNHNLFRSPTEQIDHFTLFQSFRGPDAPTYEPGAEYDLQIPALAG